MQLLEAAGFDALRVPAPVDDDKLAEAVAGVEATCLARAWFKAMAARAMLRERQGGSPEEPNGILLAADTLCALGGRLLGKPTDSAEAEVMIRTLAGETHKTITGVALLDLANDRRALWCDAASVRVGRLEDSQVSEYVTSNQWQGKSGGYNLADRIEAGWPIDYDGDPATVMGLPMKRLAPQLHELLQETAT